MDGKQGVNSWAQHRQRDMHMSVVLSPERGPERQRHVPVGLASTRLTAWTAFVTVRHQGSLDSTVWSVSRARKRSEKDRHTSWGHRSQGEEGPTPERQRKGRWDRPQRAGRTGAEVSTLRADVESRRVPTLEGEGHTGAGAALRNGFR